MAEIRGGGWLASSPVQVDWQAAEGQRVQPLATAVTDTTGSFRVPVQVPQVASGVHYVSVTQGTTTKAMPFEVSGGAAPVGADAAAREWTAGEPAGAGLRDLDLAGRPSSSSAVPVAAVSAAGVLALAGVGVVEHRRRVRVRALGRAHG